MQMNGPSPFISPVPGKEFPGRDQNKTQQPNFNVNSPLMGTNGQGSFTDDLIPYNAKFNVLKFSGKTNPKKNTGKKEKKPKVSAFSLGTEFDLPRKEEESLKLFKVNGAVKNK